jgi:hypothetical protein
VLCKTWGFHGGYYEEWCLLGCYAVWLFSACVGCSRNQEKNSKKNVSCYHHPPLRIGGRILSGLGTYTGHHDAEDVWGHTFHAQLWMYWTQYLHMTSRHRRCVRTHFSCPILNVLNSVPTQDITTQKVCEDTLFMPSSQYSINDGPRTCLTRRTSALISLPIIWPSLPKDWASDWGISWLSSSAKKVRLSGRNFVWIPRIYILIGVDVDVGFAQILL